MVKRIFPILLSEEVGRLMRTHNGNLQFAKSLENEKKIRPKTVHFSEIKGDGLSITHF